MKSLDEQLRELTASDSEPIKVSLPSPFYNRLVLAGRRRFGTIPKPELTKKALVHAAALGLLLWEKDLNSKPRKVNAVASKTKAK